MTGIVPLRAPQFWWRKPGAAATLLAPAAACYGAVAVRRLAKRGYRSALPVICIGNPTLGGAGKTPAAMLVARLLEQSGKKPFFLTRGYGGALRGPVAVDPLSHDANGVGDEALLLARTAPAIVAGDRAAGAKLAEKMGATVLVMDDGFQNPSLEKDLSILVVDGARGLGNGKVFPAGPLRAPLAPQLSRAQAMIVIGDGEQGDAAAAHARQANIPVLRARLNPDPAVAASLKGKRVLAFAGIGNPEKFFETLGTTGADIAARKSFPDHHRYSADDAAHLLAQARADNLLPVTTEKDLARMTGDTALDALRAAAQTLPVTLVFDDETELKNLIAETLAR